MERLSQSRIASSLLILLGAWLVLSPAALSYSGAALVSILGVGALVGLSGLLQMFWESSLPSWTASVLAVYLFISAFIYRLGNLESWNMAAAGVVIFLIATWDGVEIGEFHRQHNLGPKISAR